MLCVKSDSMMRPGHDEGAVGHAADAATCASRSPSRTPRSRARSVITGVTTLCSSVRQEARHLEAVDGPDAVAVEAGTLDGAHAVARVAVADQARRRCPPASSGCVFRSLKPMPSSPSRRSSAGMSGAAPSPPLRVEGVLQLVAAGLERQRPAGQRRRAAPSAAPAGCSVSCRLPSFCISVGLLLDQDQLALGDDADAVGHLLGLVDVVGGQDDGDAARRAAAAPAPTCRGAARRRRRRSARRGTGSPARAPAPWRSSPAASCRPRAS